jgi:putative ABC transport system permease protein
MRPGNVLRLYGLRLRARLTQELCAFAGIAAGVALLFAAQIANSSLHGAVAQLSHGVAGQATLQLRARDPHGFPQATLARVRALRGVRRAAPLLEADANARGPKGERSIELIGADESLAQLGGALVRHTRLSPFGQIGAVVMPAPLGSALGVTRFGQEVTIEAAGRSVEAPLYALLSKRQIGALTTSPVAVAPLSFVQQALGLQRRLTRILVQPRVGAEAAVETELSRLTGGRLDVEPVGYEQRLFAKAAEANDRSTALFAAVGALVGFLFAFNATLLTVPQRRRLAADLRRDGYTPATVIAVLGFDAAVLGLAASAAGLLLGDELSLRVFHPNPAFLSLAFALGGRRTVELQDALLAAGGGLAAAFLAAFSPLRDVLSRDPLAAIEPRERRRGRRPGGRSTAIGWAGLFTGARLEARLALLGLVCLAAATALVRIAPAAARAGMVLLAGALLAVLPLALAGTLALARALAATRRGAVGHLATMELDALKARSVAIAATGAVAVFGSVAVQGAHRDLLAGLDLAAREASASSPLWVAPAGSYDLLDTAPFATGGRRSPARLQALAKVGKVSVYRGGLLDLGARRVLVSARPSDATPPLALGQLLDGDARATAARLRRGGWLVISKALADERHLRVGQGLALPTPRPAKLRVAALSTNLGWAPGAIAMNAGDYARLWGSADASAYGVRPAPGVSPAQAAASLRRALGPRSGLAVQSATQRVAAQEHESRRALERLSQIADLIPAVAVLAMAAAMGALIWQRRPRMARLRLEGFARRELWRTTLLESLLLVGAGCLTGAIFGAYASRLADKALAGAINFPVAPSLTVLPAVRALALVTGAAVAMLAVPSYLAANVSARVALQD